MGKLGYFYFLLDLVDGAEYSGLLEIMYKMRFVSIIPNDDNRILDGLDLRDEYLDGSSELFGESNVLEVLIALSRRMNGDLIDTPYETTASDTFWLFIQNLGLIDYSNQYLNSITIAKNLNKKIDEINDILDNFVNRTYDFNGNGGLFPLKRVTFDQREVELWYQMSSYIIENYPI